jgi:hypothetical protein
LTGLENCDEPFKTPSALNIQPHIVCRVSQFDDILECSVSRRSSFDNSGLLELERAFQAMPSRITRTEKTFVSKARGLLARDFFCTSTLLEDLQEPDRHPLCLKQTWPSYKLDRGERTARTLPSQNRRSSQTGCCIILNSMYSQSQDSLGSLRESNLSDISRSSSRSSRRWKSSSSSTVSSSSRRSPLSIVRYVRQILL